MVTAGKAELSIPRLCNCLGALVCAWVRVSISLFCRGGARCLSASWLQEHVDRRPRRGSGCRGVGDVEVLAHEPGPRARQPPAQQAEQVQAPREHHAGGARGAAADHRQGRLGPGRRPGPRDAPGDGRAWWGPRRWLHGPPLAPGPHLTPSAAEARSRRPSRHMVMATFTSCTSSSRRSEPKKPSSANLAAEYGVEKDVGTRPGARERGG